MAFFVDVILPIPVKRYFTYSINEEESNFLVPGMRIAVPFGKSKIYAGIVHAIHQTPPIHYEAKEIHQILDEMPIVNSIQLKLWEWIAQYYMCAVGEVYRAAVPSAFLLESETIIQLNKETVVDDLELKDDDFLVYEALLHQPILRIQEINAIVDKKTILPIIKRLLAKNIVTVQEQIYEQYKPKLIRFVRLHEQYASEEALQNLLDQLSRAKKQKEVILTLFSLSATTRKPVSVVELAKKSNVSTSVVKSLIDKEILDEFYLQQDRIQFEGNEEMISKELNEFQEKALEEVKSSFEQHQVTLLHGVTSSGKTEIYVKLIEEALQAGKQILYLLPEIALTAQLITRLQQYFGEQVSVYHSKYSVHERVEVWNNVLENKSKAQIVIGARSAIFLPFSNLGLIVVDEEHEGTFKQYDPAPRYQARDTAVVLAAMHNAKVLLGSATPSLESYYNAQQQKYGLVSLTRRHGNVLMPAMELVDIKEAHRKKRMKGHFSERLLKEMEAALEEGEQIILFQNRRGFAPILECNTCGHSPQCPNCDVSLTYHQYKNQLRCHYCSYHIAMQKQCLACGSTELDTKGFGTEQIEKELQELFPDLKVGRMDLDSTRGKHAYEKIITAFEQQEIDILVGTQMLSKGLDFRNVTLVGVMNADNLINFPDFRAHERSFQLLLQVAGRAGRTQKRGKVLIQTYNPYHQILQQVTVNDYDGMAKEQLNERYQYKYPPFYKLIKFTLKHRDYTRVNEGADWFAKSLRNSFGAQVLGPEFPPVSRIRNQYLKNVLLKIPPKQSLQKTKEQIEKICSSFDAIPNYKGVRVVINVDNY
ncbi:replication restart DNA helicase PriA [Pustulibacterium marinum]|uniref:Replication restart protein PriA n=1 Tax=Pustulibacterium marinum TaxID=1224947 RepID=A0A1I7FTG0_9FLAO|nr:primosomal protein N' [Pustulibacterium marinum]SFU39438.1 replication restart DNA helicase PriA [Pustulibacterium marinum]